MNTAPDPIDTLRDDVEEIRRRLEVIGRQLIASEELTSRVHDAIEQLDAVDRPVTPSTEVGEVWRPPSGRTGTTAASAASTAPVTPRGDGLRRPARRAPIPAPTHARTSRPRRTVLTPERMLAIGGAVVTILGVGFLLAVAIASGLFGPVARVGSLAVLGVGLAVLAGRQKGTDAAVALAATSAASGFGVVIAMTTIYGWVPPVVGVLGAMGLAAGGTAVAHHWRSQVLAGLVFTQILLVLPFVIGVDAPAWRAQYALLAALPYVAVTFAVVAHRWMRLFAVASGGLLAVGVLALSSWPATLDVPTTLTFVAALTVFVFVAVLAAGLSSPGVLASAAAGTVACALWIGAVPDPRGWDVVVPVALATVGAAAAWRLRGSLRTVLASAACLHLVIATTVLPISGRLVLLLLAFEALVLLLGARGHRSVVFWASVALTIVVAIGLLSTVAPSTVLAPSVSAATSRWDAVVLGILVAIIGLLHLTAAVGASRTIRRAAGLFLLLYGTGAGIVAVGTLPGVGHLGAMGAGVLTTILWLGVAVVLVLRPGLRRFGYVVLVVAIAKLFLADLHAVDGILRAVLFVLTGLVLVGASSRLRTAERTEQAEHTERMPA